MRIQLSCASLALAPVALACAGETITITPLVLEGDLVTDVGLVTSISNIAVNDNGEWIVEVDTDQPDTDMDSVLIKGGVLLHQEGEPLPFPVGSSIGSFDSVVINNAGDSVWNFFLDGTAGGNDDSGIFKNTQLVVQEGNSAASAGFSPGTNYIGFFDVKYGNNDFFISVLSVDDPNINSSVDRGLVLFEDPGVGFTQHLIAAEGDVLPGQTEAVADFGTGPHESAFNDNNDILIEVDLAGDTATDGVIYLVEIDQFSPLIEQLVIVAQEGDPSPVKGRNWSSLGSPELDLNNNGDYVYSGSLDGDTNSNLLIVRNDEKFMQEGDAPPGLAAGAFAFTTFGSGPLEISDGGDVLWYGDWNDPDTTVDSALYINDVILVQEGTTMIEGQAVDTIRGVEDGYHMSNSGQYIIAELILDDGTEGAFLITRQLPCPWDLTGDNAVGPPDLANLLDNWGPNPGHPADFNGDGDVGPPDLAKLLDNWTGTGPCS